jgi:hypothetical protein
MSHAGTAAVTGPRLSQENTAAEALRTTVCRWFVESLDHLATICLDHALRCGVVSISGQLYVGKPLISCLRQQQLQCPGCVSSMSFPRDHRVANMSQTIWREFCSAWLPAKTNRPAEFSVPHPLRVAGQTSNRGTVWQIDSRPFGIPVNLLSDPEGPIPLKDQRKGDTPVAQGHREIRVRRQRPAALKGDASDDLCRQAIIASKTRSTFGLLFRVSVRLTNLLTLLRAEERSSSIVYARRQLQALVRPRASPGSAQSRRLKRRGQAGPPAAPTLEPSGRSLGRRRGRQIARSR